MPYNIREAAHREAINAPIQGTSADITKLAMIDLHRELKERASGASMLLQVHDELLLEVPEGEIDTIVPLVRETMRDAFELKVPIKVDVKVGHNWRDMEIAQ